MPIYQKCPDGYFIVYNNGNRKKTTEATYLRSKKRIKELHEKVKRIHKRRAYQKEYYRKNN